MLEYKNIDIEEVLETQLVGQEVSFYTSIKPSGLLHEYGKTHPFDEGIQLTGKVEWISIEKIPYEETQIHAVVAVEYNGIKQYIKLSIL